MEDARIWKALGSPHRRALLDALRDGAKTTTALCEVLPQLSRYAVMQHLRVLEHAGVVLVRREGRKRWNELNAVPLQRELASASQLLAFERHLRQTTEEET